MNGKLLLHKDGHSAGTVSKGEAIELLAVLRGGQSSFVVGADEPVSVLRIAAATLRAVLARDPKVVRYFERPLEWPGASRFRQLLRDYGISRSCAVELVAAMTLRTAPAGTRLATEGAAVGALQIINKGNVSGSKTLDGVSALVSQFGEGSLFGGAELCLEKGYGLSYEAVTDVELIEIDRAVVLAALRGAPELTSLLEAFGVFGQRAAEPAAPTASARGASSYGSMRS